jgi:hypothetical protein
MLLPFTDGLIRTNHFDPEMAALADRHYTRQTIGARQFAGNGEKIVLRDSAGLILFVWLKQSWRLDSLAGFNCQWFRNESERRASEIILEAESFAVERWGPGLAFTFVDPSKIRSVNPGCCFKKAGWRQIPGFTTRRKIVFIKGIK